MYIDLADLSTADQELADACVSNAKRYTDLFYEAVQDLLPEYKDKEVNIIPLSLFFIFSSKMPVQSNNKLSLAPSSLVEQGGA